jgi:hypothetical protein
MTTPEIPPIRLPPAFRALIVRSDGNQAEIYLAPGKRRVDDFSHGGISHVTIALWNLKRLFRYDVQSKSLKDFPLEESESHEFYSDFLWTDGGSEQVSGVEYKRYELFLRNDLGRVAKVVLVDNDSGVPFRIQTIDRNNQVSLTIEYRNVTVGAPSESVFAIPPSAS